MGKLTEKDEEAIAEIETFKTQITSLTDSGKSTAWHNKIIACLEKWIGIECPLTTMFARDLSFSRPGTYPTKYFSNDAEIQKQFNSCLTEIQDYIKIHGIIEPPKEIKVNWFFTLKTPAAISLISLVGGVLTTIGIFISVNIKDRNYLKLENRYEKLRDSLFVVSSVKDFKIETNSTANSSNQPDTNSVKH